MVVSVSNFFNELDRFEIKCETLQGVVDLHVIAEAPLTYTGIPKPMHFHENRERYSKYPIHYIDLSYLPDTRAMKENPWRREEAQREAVTAELSKINPEIVIFGDTDETPKPDVVEKFRSLNCEIANLEMDMLFYFFNKLHPDKWPYQRICKFRGKVAPRGDFSLPWIKDAGWHFAYFGGKETLLKKIKATSHAVEEGAKIFYDLVTNDKYPNLDICTEYPVEKLPQFVQDNQERFKHWFMS